VEAAHGKTAPARLASIDAYRGFVMLLMMAEVLQLEKVASEGTSPACSNPHRRRRVGGLCSAWRRAVVVGIDPRSWP